MQPSERGRMLLAYFMREGSSVIPLSQPAFVQDMLIVMLNVYRSARSGCGEQVVLLDSRFCV